MQTLALQPKIYYSDKRAFMCLCSMSLILFVLYVYFISASVVHVVMRTEISHDITKLSSDISGLESSYIQEQHKVSADIASLQGYAIATEKTFIDKKKDNLVLRSQNQ